SRTPPLSLFPYTTLFRSRDFPPACLAHFFFFQLKYVSAIQHDPAIFDLARRLNQVQDCHHSRGFATAGFTDEAKTFISLDGEARSEEHTSELQSLRHLVC